MKTRFLRHILLRGAALFASGLAPAALAAPTAYPTGVTIHDHTHAYETAICFSGPDGNTHVVDMDGREIHRWTHVGLPGAVIDPSLVGGATGHVLLQLSRFPDALEGILGNRTVGELDWQGHVVWEWGDQAPGGGARQNHDWARLPGGDTLLLVAFPHAVAALGPHVLNDQAIYQVSKTGQIVWRWIAGEHLDEFGISKAGFDYLRLQASDAHASDWGYLEINDMQRLGANRWFDAGDTRFAPDNIMIDSRKGNFIVILDKKTGHVVWRLGPDFRTGPGDADRRILNDAVPRPVDQISGQHDAHLIPNGLPGAGNLLLFDDQGSAGFPRTELGVCAGSRILEIDPVKQQIVWQYTAADSGLPPWTFFSSFVSSAQRLPNGNTLIDEGMTGRIFQVTSGGRNVWEYMSPYRGTVSMGGHPVSSALIFRAQAVPAAWLPKGAGDK